LGWIHHANRDGTWTPQIDYHISFSWSKSLSFTFIGVGVLFAVVRGFNAGSYEIQEPHQPGITLPTGAILQTWMRRDIV
jgi:hypothetical protein